MLHIGDFILSAMGSTEAFWKEKRVTYTLNRSGQGSSRRGEMGTGRTATMVTCTGNRYEMHMNIYNWMNLITLEHRHMLKTSKHCTAWSNKVPFWSSHLCIHPTFTHYLKTIYSNAQMHYSAVSILLSASAEFSTPTVFFIFIFHLIMFVTCLVFSHHIHFLDLLLHSSSLSLNNIECTFKSFILSILDFSLSPYIYK